MHRNKMTGAIGAIGLLWLGTAGTAFAEAPCDFLCAMTAANEASLVMLREQDLLPPGWRARSPAASSR